MGESTLRNPRGPHARARSRDRRAFTLIELLVVISIIVLMVAILTPGLAKARLLSKRAACLSNLRCMGIAAGAYQVPYGEYVPICWENVPAASYPCPWKSWRCNLLPYSGGYAAFNCPAATDWGQQTELFHSVQELEGQDWSSTTNAGSYGVMYQESLPLYTTPDFYGEVARGHPAWSCAFSSKSGAAWTDPSASVYVADSCLGKGLITYPSQGYRGLGTSAIMPPSDPAYSDGSLARRFADRHAGTNCLFVDGHVSSYPTQQLDSMVAGATNCIWDVN
jgi:prepilin-type N-terminal cleavage/methylation domain-containing protein/prepilin-type processing-associated H-X9-DG protein